MVRPCAQASDRIEYVYDIDGRLIGEYPIGGSSANAVEYLWLDDTPIAVLQRRPGSANGGPTGGGIATAWNGTQAGGVDIYHLQPDHLDTPRVVLNAQNQAIWRWDSAPFGDTLANEQPSGGLPSYTLNLRFPGQQYDTETGTHYNYFRDYEPGSGRYVQSDPIGITRNGGLYSYVEGAPAHGTDELGLKLRDSKGRFTPDPCNPPGPGKKKIPKSLKNEVRDENRARNDGNLLCDECGIETVLPQKHEKDVSPPDNEAHIDHIDPESKGGKTEKENLRNVCRRCNLKKGAGV